MEEGFFKATNEVDAGRDLKEEASCLWTPLGRRTPLGPFLSSLLELSGRT